MATSKRCPTTGFYKALNSLSSAELYEHTTTTKRPRLQVSDDLPQGMYKVERLVAERTTVSSTSSALVLCLFKEWELI